MTRRFMLLALATVSVLVLAGCKPDNKEARAPAPRPVLSAIAKTAVEKRPTFVGTVQPRYQTDRGFQVLGRIIARHVDVGDVVTPGQRLAEIEPLTYQLAVQSGEASLMRAKSEFTRASGARERTATLVASQASPQSDLDAADRSLETAAAAVRQAEASIVKARENLQYTTLTADSGGVVTSVYANVGQTAAPGTRVLTVARTDIREAVVDLPENIVASLQPGSAFEVSLQADPSVTSAGKVREIAPQADAATRTRKVNVTLERTDDAFRLGAVISAAPRGATGSPELEIPETALLEKNGAVLVWTVDPQSKSVRSIPVQIASRDHGIARIASGLSAGTRVVTAGVHSLKDGQSIATSEGDQK
jgi:membrane fusion protein, multidrug efflux system